MPFSSTEILDALGLFSCLAGFIIGLGAVTIIDIHGFLGRHSHYWTETTIRVHKITKPLIWVGISLLILGSLIFFRAEEYSSTPLWFFLLIPLLIANGLFLSFWLSPRLIEREKEGRADEILPDNWQRAITLSFLISFGGWWSLVVLFVFYLIR